MASRTLTAKERRGSLHYGSIVNWVVKASKLCNLRCRYCYEWNELHRRDRIALDDWERLLSSVAAYHDQRVAETGNAFQTRIIWHGGEPLLLPSQYIEAVMSLQRRILGPERLARGEFVNFLQSNLYVVTDEKLDILKREGIRLGISMDVVEGVRLTAGGQPTEDHVAENIDRLLERDIGFGGIVVLAGHTLKRATEILDFYQALDVPVRFLPLFQSPLNTPSASFAATDAQLVEALEQLFLHWMRSRRPVKVHPLMEYLGIVWRKKHGAVDWPYDRATNGEWALLVNTDGALYQVHEAYREEYILGNVFRQPLGEILASRAYRESLARDAVLRDRHCAGCEYRGACSTLPLFESARDLSAQARCPIAYPALVRIEGRLERSRSMEARVHARIGRRRSTRLY